MDFKDKIKQRRTQLGMSMEEVAEIVGVSKATVQRWESGEIKNVRRDKIFNLSKALKCSTSWLMGWEDESNKISVQNKALIDLIQTKVSIDKLHIVDNDVDFIIKYLKLNDDVKKEINDFIDFKTRK